MNGKRLRELRKDEEMSQEDLADVLNVKRGIVGHYETEKSNPSQEVLLKIADYFKVSVDYLLGKTDLKKAYVMDKNLPTELTDIGIKALDVTKELFEKGLTAEDIIKIATVYLSAKNDRT